MRKAGEPSAEGHERGCPSQTVEALGEAKELQLKELRELVDQVNGVRFSLGVDVLASCDFAKRHSLGCFRALSKPYGLISGGVQDLREGWRLQMQRPERRCGRSLWEWTLSL